MAACKNALLVVRIYPEPNLPVLYLSAVKTIYYFANRMLIQHFNRSIIVLIVHLLSLYTSLHILFYVTDTTHFFELCR